MKKLLILAYVIAVLLLSGMVKADQSGIALVESAQISPSGIITVDSYMPTPCHQFPRIVVSNINETDKTLKLVVQTQIRNQICPDIILETPKKVIFDLKQLPLRVGNTYNVTFEHYVGAKALLTYKAISNDFNLEQFDLKENDFKGTLINFKRVDAGFPNVVLALQKGSDIWPVATTDMSLELSLLVGGEVHITGYVLNAANMLDSANELAQSSQIKSMIVPVSVSQ